MKKFDRKQFSKEGKRSAANRGLTILHIGEGKGKTTAAVGLAVRARGAGMSVCFVQFMKTEKWQSYERRSLQKLGIPVHVLGSGFVGIIDDTQPLAAHKRSAKKALSISKALLKRYDVLICDEVVTAIEEGLLTQANVLALIKARPPKTHLVLTGHTKYPKLIAACDLVTEMTNIKHPYYTQGILAQRGIDF